MSIVAIFTITKRLDAPHPTHKHLFMDHECITKMWNTHEMGYSKAFLFIDLLHTALTKNGQRNNNLLKIYYFKNKNYKFLHMHHKAQLTWRSSQSVSPYY
jgi:hypothetical protein